MHERHALHHGFLVEPSTINELLAALPPDQLFPQLHLGDERTTELLDRALAVFLADPSGEGCRLRGASGGHYVFWASAEFFVEGVVYPNGDDPDETSPVALVERFDRTLVYGPGVVRLGTLVLGAALVPVALGASAPDPATHQGVFGFAPWPDRGATAGTGGRRR